MFAFQHQLLSDISAWKIRGGGEVTQLPWENSGWCLVGWGVQYGSTFPSLITPPAGLNESWLLKHFAPLVLICLWSNEQSGPSVLTHYLDIEPELDVGGSSAQISLECSLFSDTSKHTVQWNWCCCCLKITFSIFERFVKPCMKSQHFGDVWFYPQWGISIALRFFLNSKDLP